VTGWWLVSYVALWVISFVMVALQVGTLRELGLLQRRVHTPASQFEPVDAQSDGPEIGSMPPAAIFAAADGYGTVTLGQSDLGVKTLLVFMTPTCEGCQLAIDPLNSIAAEMSSEVQTQVVLSGPESMCASFVKLFPLRMPVVFDPTHEVADMFAVRRIPSGLLYDEHGLLVSKGLASSSRELLALLDGAPSGRAPVPVPSQ
jgi:methylamine dehydrogenase accessory protein MauD